MKKGFLILSGLLMLIGCERSLSDGEVQEFKEKGNSISLETYQKLSATLKEKMTEGGIPVALKYCNTNALPLTNEMSQLRGVTIKRTALKLRNKSNSPDQEELIILKRFKDMADKAETIEPVVQLDQQGDPHYYAPILLEKKCLPCHGTLGKEVPAAVDSIIKIYYPDDMALGFKADELRGLWSIGFSNLN